MGEATAETRLEVDDDAPSATTVVDLPMPVLLGKLPSLERSAVHEAFATQPFGGRWVGDLRDAIHRVLRLPAVAAKTFLITIGDRTVGGLTVRDQMVGPWQVPVADCAVTASGFTATTGEAMAVGERPALALLDAPASGRMAVAEAITNLMAARIDRLSDVRLSANWMASSGDPAEDARLYDTVRAVGAELCPALGISIPVGKDSLSMRTQWREGDTVRTQRAPLTLNISAFAPVADVRGTLTPWQLQTAAGPTTLLLVDLGAGRHPYGWQCTGAGLREFGRRGAGSRRSRASGRGVRAGAAPVGREAVARLSRPQRRRPADDRLRDGVCRAPRGVEIALDGIADAPLTALFSEELGFVLQVASHDAAAVVDELDQAGLRVQVLGRPTSDDRLRVSWRGATIFEEARPALQRIWAETSYRIQALRDEPGCAREEFESLGDPEDAGLQVLLTSRPSPPAVLSRRPPVAILREQGVNGQAEMAACLPRRRLRSHRRAHERSAGRAPAAGILCRPRRLRRLLLRRCARCRTRLGGFGTFSCAAARGVHRLPHAPRRVCPGGVQRLPDVCRTRRQRSRKPIPAALRAQSLGAVRGALGAGRDRRIALDLLPRPGWLAASVAVAHGEGRAQFEDAEDLQRLAAANQLPLRFVDHRGAATERYPANPNGSPDGITGVCNSDGRITLLMPHPERTIAGVTGSWWPERSAAHTPWLEIFHNARRWVG